MWVAGGGRGIVVFCLVSGFFFFFGVLVRFLVYIGCMVVFVIGGFIDRFDVNVL